MLTVIRRKLWRPGHLDREALTRERPSKWDDMRELAGLLASAKGPWKQQLAEIWVNGVPMNVAGGLAGLEVNPPSADLSSVTVNATEAALWPTSWTPVSAQRQAPTAFYLKAYGVATSAATPGTQTFNPRIGTSSSGISLGISSNLTPTASETAVVWRIEGDLAAPRSAGASTVATATGYFEYHQTTGTSGNAGYLTGTPLIFGGTSSTWDNTVAQALFMGVVAATSTTNTMTPRLIVWASWN